MVFIYTISCPVSGLVRYVGKTNNTKERFRKHLSENNQTKKSRWIKGLKNKGLKPVFEIIDECTECDWQEKERQYIKVFKSVGANLLNEMPGGEGGATMKGKKLSKEQVQKIIDSKIGKANPSTAITNKLHKGYAINQHDLSGNLIASHQSINDAAKHINRSSRRIQMMLSGTGKTVNHVGGYRFSKA